MKKHASFATVTREEIQPLLVDFVQKLKNSEVKKIDRLGGKFYLFLKGGVLGVDFSYGDPDDRAVHEWIQDLPSVKWTPSPEEKADIAATRQYLKFWAKEDGDLDGFMEDIEGLDERGE